ncbi:MAG: AMP-binding protein, partial [Rhodospirillaceae bacterium]|nr:AMP-binding protein [Rhodospirillaceae bacterium]
MNYPAHDLASDRRFTYAEFHDRIDRAALYLRDGLGVGDGDRVAVLCHNDTDVFELQFACRRIGAIFLPLNWRLAVPELEYICNDATPAAMLHGLEFTAEAAEVQRLAGVPRIATMNNGGSSDYEAGLAAA